MLVRVDEAAIGNGGDAHVCSFAAGDAGDRISKRFTNEIVSVLIELPLPLDKPTALWRYLPLPYLEI